jgi:hypothetical protein
MEAKRMVSENDGFVGVFIQESSQMQPGKFMRQSQSAFTGQMLLNIGRN